MKNSRSPIGAGQSMFAWRRLVFAGFAVAVSAYANVGMTSDRVDFVRDVQPILSRHCVRCHRPGNSQGDIQLHSAADLMNNQYVIPELPEESELLRLVQSTNGEAPLMPKEGDPLTTEQTSILVRWIEQGANWPADVIVAETAKTGREWWSLQPLARATLPQIPNAPPGWRANPIDRFVYARMRAHNLTPSNRAHRETLIRRATYDLTGLPPRPEEIEAFLSDSSVDAYQRVVDRLLGSPAYGERWGRFWLDVVRFGESRGFERNEIINNIWPFRDYVIDSFNVDKPFDQLILEHLAGDTLGDDDPQVQVGTAFLVCGPYDDVGNLDPMQAAQIRANTIDEMIRATSEAFLGLTVGCARCHDHKFDPILQRDYYALYATFAGVHHGARVVATQPSIDRYRLAIEPLLKVQSDLDKQLQALNAKIDEQAEAASTASGQVVMRPAVDRRLTREEFGDVEALYVRLRASGNESDPAAPHGFTIDEFEVWSADAAPRNVALADLGATAEGGSRVADDFVGAYSPVLTIDGRFGARWIATGPTLTIRLARPVRINAVTFSSDRQGDAGDHSIANFVADYQIQTSLDGKDWREVANSFDRAPVNSAHRRHRLRMSVIGASQQSQLADLRRRLNDVQAQIRAIDRPAEWWVGEFRKSDGPYHVFLGGDPQRLGDAVHPASLAILEDTVSYRTDDPDESNRRRGLAEWITDRRNPLTARVLANRIWQNHFGVGIVATPSDFGGMGQLPTHPELLDFLALHLLEHQWQIKPLHRLIMLSQTYQQSSTYRADAAAADGTATWLWRARPRRLTAEEIRDTMLDVAGQLDRRMGGPGFRLYRYLQDNVATYVPLDDHGPETFRRSVYHQNARAMRIDVMTDFDCPDNAFAAPTRAITTTPLQALALLNHQFSLRMSQCFADRLEACEPSVDQQVYMAYRMAYGRPPGQDEVESATAFVRSHGLRAFCRAILNSSELIYLD